MSNQKLNGENMILFHLLYTDKNGQFKNEHRYYNNFEDAENYLKSIGAVYWEIGIPDGELWTEMLK